MSSSSLDQAISLWHQAVALEAGKVVVPPYEVLSEALGVVLHDEPARINTPGLTRQVMSSAVATPLLAMVLYRTGLGVFQDQQAACLAQVLLEHGADPNLAYRTHRPVDLLISAIQQGHRPLPDLFPLLQVLIQHGFDPSLSTRHTPLEIKETLENKLVDSQTILFMFAEPNARVLENDTDPAFFRAPRRSL